MSDASSRITAEETAQKLGISVDEVIGLRRRGKLRGYPDYGNWVFEEADVARLAEEMQVVEPGGPDSTTSEPEPPARSPTDSDPSPTPPVSPTEPADGSSPYQPATLSSQIDDKPEPDQARTSSSPYVPAPAPTGSTPPQTSQAPVPEKPAEPPSTPEPDSAPVSPPVSAAPPTPDLSLEQLVGSDLPIDSARIIEGLAARHRIGFEQAAGVVDGFWEHLLHPRHYKQGRRKLHMPHFGMFRLKRNRHGETELLFVSRPLSELRLHRGSSGQQDPSTIWIEHWERFPATPSRLENLSLKRRLAVAIADDTGLDLKTTFLVLWDLVETITGILVGGEAEIRWARRGVMRANSPTTPSHYEFRTYKRLRDHLPQLAPPTQRTRHRQREGASADHTQLLTKLGCAAVILFVVVFACLFGMAISEF